MDFEDRRGGEAALESLYAQGRFFCTSCRRYKFDKDVEKVEGRGDRLYCKECGTQVRTGPKDKTDIEQRETRQR